MPKAPATWFRCDVCDQEAYATSVESERIDPIAAMMGQSSRAIEAMPDGWFQMAVRQNVAVYEDGILVATQISDQQFVLCSANCAREISMNIFMEPAPEGVRVFTPDDVAGIEEALNNGY